MTKVYGNVGPWSLAWAVVGRGYKGSTKSKGRDELVNGREHVWAPVFALNKLMGLVGAWMSCDRGSARPCDEFAS